MRYLKIMLSLIYNQRKNYTMKRLIFILLLIPSVGFSQTTLNNDSLLYHFTHILNNYRTSHGLQPLMVDLSIKDFTDNWSKKMASTGLVGHGDKDISWEQRVRGYTKFPIGRIVSENCTNIHTPDFNTNDSVVCSFKDKEIEPYVKKSYSGKITQYELAYFAFLNFKRSPPHHAFMLKKDVKYFYISGYRGKGGWTYISYVAIT